MKTSKKDSSAITARAPFEPATELAHVRIVLYEIEDVAERGKEKCNDCYEILDLIRSVNRVLTADVVALKNLPRVADITAA